MVTLYNGDCLVEMEKIPDGSVDMILCDLPYGVLHKNNPNVQWDRIIPFEPLWEQYLRVIKPAGAIVLFGQGMFTAQLMMSQPKLWKYNLVWNKMRATGFLNANRMPLRYHEDILVFYDSLPTYNPQMEPLNGREPSHPQGGASIRTRISVTAKSRGYTARNPKPAMTPLPGSLRLQTRTSSFPEASSPSARSTREARSTLHRKASTSAAI